MKNISIVTAFFDIGRGDWSMDKGHPHYLHRTTDTYIERFTHLTKLKNEIIVITSPDIAEKLKKVSDRIKVIEYDPFTEFSDVSKKIVSIHNNEAYKRMIEPSQIKNPEYWSEKYVLVNLLKSTFVNLAIDKGLVTNDTVAWLDFGYCRSEQTLPKSLEWCYDFDPEKIHLFSYKDLKPNVSFKQVVVTNDVHILGAKMVADKKLWPFMRTKMFEAFEQLYSEGLTDDDQSMMLMCATQYPNLFQQHRIPDHQFGLDAFVIFKNFNTLEK